jgi:hypothetical protein
MSVTFAQYLNTTTAFVYILPHSFLATVLSLVIHPVLGNDLKTKNIRRPSLSNGFANKNISTATREDNPNAL